MTIELKNYPRIAEMMQKRYDKLEFRAYKQESRISRLILSKHSDIGCVSNIKAARTELAAIKAEMKEIEAAYKHLNYLHLENSFLASLEEISTYEKVEEYERMFIGNKDFEIDLNLPEEPPQKKIPWKLYSTRSGRTLDYNENTGRYEYIQLDNFVEYVTLRLYLKDEAIRRCYKPIFKEDDKARNS